MDEVIKVPYSVQEITENCNIIGKCNITEFCNISFYRKLFILQAKLQNIVI